MPIERAPDHVLTAARRIDAALNARAIDVLGESLPPSTYLADLRALTVLLLHLATQMGGEQHAPWADRARIDRARSSGDRGARWGLAPPANLQLRGEALAAADEILRAASIDLAADRLHAWTELTPHTPDGQLGWLADHTSMTPLLSRLIMAATAPRRRLATLLDTSLPNTSGRSLAMTAIPQVVPADLYTKHFGGMLDVTDRTGRLFVALCLARQHPSTGTWAEAAAALRLPTELGTKTARACSADLLAPARDFIAALAQAADDLDPTVDHRNRENSVRRLPRRRGWYRPWARIHLPGSHRQPAIRHHLALDRIRTRPHRHQPRLAAPARPPRSRPLPVLRRPSRYCRDRGTDGARAGHHHSEEEDRMKATADIWGLWDCEELLSVHLTPHDAIDARDEHLSRCLCFADDQDVISAAVEIRAIHLLGDLVPVENRDRSINAGHHEDAVIGPRRTPRRFQ